MAREKQRDRVYLKGVRFYADFRDYADVGGGRTALIPKGQRIATKNRDEASIIATEHLRRFDADRHGHAFGGITALTTLTTLTTLANASMTFQVHSTQRSRNANAASAPPVWCSATHAIRRRLVCRTTKRNLPLERRH